MSPGWRKVIRMLIVASILAVVVLGGSWVAEDYDRGQERLEERAYVSTYRRVYKEVLDALADSLSVGARSQSAEAESARAGEITDRLMDVLRDNPETLEWLKSSQAGQ